MLEQKLSPAPEWIKCKDCPVITGGNNCPIYEATKDLNESGPEALLRSVADFNEGKKNEDKIQAVGAGCDLNSNIEWWSVGCPADSGVFSTFQPNESRQRVEMDEADT